MAKKVIEIDCAPDTTYKFNPPTVVTGQFPEFCKCAGTAVINVSLEENVDLHYDQSNGMFTADYIDKTQPAIFEYSVICKNPDPCPDCPDCKGEVDTSTGRVEIPALCEDCTPTVELVDLTGENLPEDPQAPDFDCAEVANPFTYTEEYYNGYVRWILKDCEWHGPIVRDFTGEGTLDPNK